MTKKLSLIYLIVVLVLGIIATSDMVIQKACAEGLEGLEALEVTAGQAAEGEEDKGKAAKKTLETDKGDPENREKRTDKRSVSGRVSLIRDDYINVVYKEDKKKGVEYEMGFKLNGAVQLSHKKLLDSLERGDFVSIEYDEMAESYDKVAPDGTKERKNKVTGREARAISFKKSASSALVSGE
ncbi:MAG: hypothetical protein ABH843_05375 [Candidatus Omnitrophota bacterium]